MQIPMHGDDPRRSRPRLDDKGQRYIEIAYMSTRAE